MMSDNRFFEPVCLLKFLSKLHVILQFQFIVIKNNLAANRLM